VTRLSPEPFPRCHVQQNLWTMRYVSELLSLQLKIYTEFNGHLSCRKIGAKSLRRVCLFANADNQYIVLSKRLTLTDVQSSASAVAGSVATGTSHLRSPYQYASAENMLHSSRAPLASADWSTEDFPASDMRFPRAFAPSYPAMVPTSARCVAPLTRGGLSPKTIHYSCNQPLNGSSNSAMNAIPSTPAIARCSNFD
jgi:hypothetical protein